jgi:hypothetical protein
MASIIVSNTPPFGQMSNQTIADLHTIDQAMARLAAAVATAQSGWTGTPGAEFEGSNNNFGVVASETPGEQGSAFAYALGNLTTEWATFWTTAKPSIDAIDNGVRSP